MVNPAGFWHRYVAYFLDWLIVNAGVQLLTALPSWWLLHAAQPALLQAAQVRPGTVAELAAALWPVLLLLGQLSLLSLLAYAALGAVYFIGLEASDWQATLGKRALGLIVTDAAGRRLSRRRASARYFAAALSWLSLNLGHALAAWRSDKRALHDLVADTRVVHGPGVDPALPGWAWAVLALHAGGFLLLTLALAALLALLFSAALAGLPY